MSFQIIKDAKLLRIYNFIFSNYFLLQECERYG